ncbi:MAG: sporulation transcription factor Spo0A [Clostridia bacterium]|nr:sporulation transcription factor Spo0A [Clostridia bacterium]
MKIRLLLADGDETFLQKERAYFNKSNDYEVVGVANNGIEAVELYNRTRPDATVIDLFLPIRDGISALGGINKGNGKIVAVSGINSPAYIQKAMDGGADYFLLKPYELAELDAHLQKLVTAKPQKQRYSSQLRSGVDQRITEIFMTVGIPAHIKGYQFLREAIKMAIDAPEIINSITKRLYPEVAERFETSPSKVERAIRHAIEVAWNKGKIENINSIFGVKVYSPNEKPTNGEFIALVADKMLLENI